MIRPVEGKSLHLVGIGGIGMSALARWLLANGYTVTGCDREENDQTAALDALGARVCVGHDGRHVNGADLVVITSAVGADNPDVAAAGGAGVPIMKRAELLARIANAGRAVAVAGTHGKTTTSALVGHMLTEAGLDPTVLIGGLSANLGSNARIGGEITVVEADEYDASFLQLRPEIAVITNVEAEHLDFYGSFEGVRAAFAAFAARVERRLILCVDDPVTAGLAQSVGCPLGPEVRTYGIVAGDLQAREIVETGDRTRFLAVDGTRQLRLEMRLAGIHMVQNALAAVLVARSLGIGDNEIAHALAGFGGVARRLELKGEEAGVVVIDDYAHHPTEIQANLAALRKRYQRPIHLVFQPHTYSRTKSFLPEFAISFAGADAVYLLDIYASRERETLGISGRDLADEAVRRNLPVAFTPSKQEAVDALLLQLRPGDLVVTMGAGDVYTVGLELLEGLRNR